MLDAGFDVVQLPTFYFNKILQLSYHRQYQEQLETTNTWTVTGFSVLSANFPYFR